MLAAAARVARTHLFASARRAWWSHGGHVAVTWRSHAPLGVDEVGVHRALAEDQLDLPPVPRQRLVHGKDATATASRDIRDAVCMQVPSKEEKCLGRGLHSDEASAFARASVQHHCGHGDDANVAALSRTRRGAAVRLTHRCGWSARSTRAEEWDGMAAARLTTSTMAAPSGSPLLTL